LFICESIRLFTVVNRECFDRLADIIEVEYLPVPTPQSQTARRLTIYSCESHLYTPRSTSGEFRAQVSRFCCGAQPYTLQLPPIIFRDDACWHEKVEILERMQTLIPIDFESKKTYEEMFADGIHFKSKTFTMLGNRTLTKRHMDPLMKYAANKTITFNFDELFSMELPSIYESVIYSMFFGHCVLLTMHHKAEFSTLDDHRYQLAQRIRLPVFYENYTKDASYTQVYYFWKNLMGVLEPLYIISKYTKFYNSVLNHGFDINFSMPGTSHEVCGMDFDPCIDSSDSNKYVFSGATVLINPFARDIHFRQRNCIGEVQEFVLKEYSIVILDRNFSYGLASNCGTEMLVFFSAYLMTITLKNELPAKFFMTRYGLDSVLSIAPEAAVVTPTHPVETKNRGTKRPRSEEANVIVFD
jgi:hypothetical protein